MAGASASAKADGPAAALSGEPPPEASASAAAPPLSSAEAARRRAIQNELDQLDLQMLAALSSAGRVDSVLRDSTVPFGLLEDPSRSSAGTGITAWQTEGAVKRESGVLVAVVPDDPERRAAAGELLEKIVRSGPKGSVAVGGASVSDGAVSNASAVVAGMAAGFRRCYNRGLKEDPSMKGSLRIVASIGPNGEVTNARVAESRGNLGETVKSCVQARVSAAHFAAPDGGKAQVTIPVSFVNDAP